MSATRLVLTGNLSPAIDVWLVQDRFADNEIRVAELLPLEWLSPDWKGSMPRLAPSQHW